MKFLFALSIFLITLAHSAPALALEPMVCIPYKDLTAGMTTEGSVRINHNAIADGRIVQTYYKAETGLWTIVVIERPNGRLSSTSCAKIFGVGDPGVFIPTKLPA